MQWSEIHPNKKAIKKFPHAKLTHQIFLSLPQAAAKNIHMLGHRSKNPKNIPTVPIISMAPDPKAKNNIMPHIKV